jgi:hypothetical protein
METKNQSASSLLPAPLDSSSGHPHCTQSENRPRHGEENVVSPEHKYESVFKILYTEKYLALKTVFRTCDILERIRICISD